MANEGGPKGPRSLLIVITKKRKVFDGSDGMDPDVDAGVDESLTDCDDCDSLNPQCEEFCNDGIDNDGDGLTDCTDSECCSFIGSSIADRCETTCEIDDDDES